MIITPITAGQPSFGYHHPLKTMFIKGELPLKYGFYGDKLTKKNASLEHLRPVSKGGQTVLENLVLASKEKNTERGNQPLSKYLNMEALHKYIDFFLTFKTNSFDGAEYAAKVLKTIEDLIRKGD